MHKYLLSTLLLTFSGFTFSQITDPDSSSVQKIDEVQVSSFYGEIVFEKADHLVIDFLINSDQSLLIIKNRKDYKLSMYDKDFTFVHSISIDFKPKNLFEDCFGNFYIFSEENMHPIEIVNDSVHILAPEPLDAYLKYYRNCYGSLGNQMIMIKNTDFGVTQEYFSFDLAHQQERYFYQISDTARKEDAERLFYEIEVKRGRSVERMKEINIAQLKRVRGAFDDVQFYDQVQSKPMYNPLFIDSNRIMIFNHFNSVATIFNTNLEEIASIPIDYHQSINWNKQVLFDQERKKLYSMNLENGVSSLIYLKNEDLKEVNSIPLSEASYPEKVMVSDGFAYYLIFPNMDRTFSRLYRQKL